MDPAGATRAEPAQNVRDAPRNGVLRRSITGSIPLSSDAARRDAIPLAESVEIFLAEPEPFLSRFSRNGVAAGGDHPALFSRGAAIFFPPDQLGC